MYPTRSGRRRLRWRTPSPFVQPPPGRAIPLCGSCPDRATSGPGAVGGGTQPRGHHAGMGRVAAGHQHLEHQCPERGRPGRAFYPAHEDGARSAQVVLVQGDPRAGRFQRMGRHGAFRRTAGHKVTRRGDPAGREPRRDQRVERIRRQGRGTQEIGRLLRASDIPQAELRHQKQAQEVRIPRRQVEALPRQARGQRQILLAQRGGVSPRLNLPKSKHRQPIRPRHSSHRPPFGRPTPPRPPATARTQPLRTEQVRISQRLRDWRSWCSILKNFAVKTSLTAIRSGSLSASPWVGLHRLGAKHPPPCAGGEKCDASEGSRRCLICRVVATIRPEFFPIDTSWRQCPTRFEPWRPCLAACCLPPSSPPSPPSRPLRFSPRLRPCRRGSACRPMTRFRPGWRCSIRRCRGPYTRCSHGSTRRS